MSFNLNEETINADSEQETEQMELITHNQLEN